MAILAVFSINTNYFLDFFNKGLTPYLIFTKNLLIIFYTLQTLEKLRNTSFLLRKCLISLKLTLFFYY